MEGFTKIRLFSDVCRRQNKNKTVVGMIMYWLLTKAASHIQTIEILFPIAGYLFIPPDRVFGVLEKEFCPLPGIEARSYYIKIIESVVMNPGHCQCKFQK